MSTFTNEEPRSDLGLVAQYVLVQPRSGTVRRVVFSPAFPDYCAVIYWDRAPRLFDVRSQLPSLIQRTVITEELRPLILDESIEVKINGRTPATDAAFRPGLEGPRADEVAFAFGEGCDVQRLGLRLRRARPSVSAEDTVSLTYSSCGRRLLCGGTNGLLSLFDVVETPLLVNSARGNGAVVAVDINYRELCLGVTDSSLFFGFDAKSSFSRQYDFRDGDDIENREALWSALVCDPSSSFVFAATEHGRFWVARTESFDGASCDSIVNSRVLGAQFLPENWLMVTQEKGVVMHRYETNDDGKIVGMAVGDVFDLDDQKGTVCGARWYEFAGYRAICIAVSIN